MSNLVIPGGRRALPTPLTQAEKDAIAAGVDNVAIAAANANAASIVAINAVGTHGLIYVSDTGNDNNNGQTLATSVRTWVKVMDMLKTSTHNYVYVSGDLDIDYYRLIEKTFTSIRFLQAPGGAAARLVNKTASNLAGYCGIWTQGSYRIRIDIPVHMDAVSNYGLVNSNVVQDLGVYYAGGAPTQSAQNTSCMWFTGSGGELNVVMSGSPITNVAGRVFYGIAAGINPETNKYIKSNIAAG